MIEDALRRIGLTEGEIRVYLALLELGSSSTGKITKLSHISGSKVYEVLDRLITKGIVGYVIKNGVKHFEATGPERILNYLETKGAEIEAEKRNIQEIIPQLILKQKTAQKSVAKIFTGWEGMKTANRDIINSLKKGEKWLSMGLTEQPKHYERYFDHDQKERSSKGIIHMGLHNELYKDLMIKRGKLPHTEYRMLPKDFAMPTSTEIYGNKVAIFIIEPANPMVIMIESKHVADSFRKYFYALWDSKLVQRFK